MLPSIGSQGPGRAGKDGTKVRRVARFTMKVEESGPIEGPSRAGTRERPKAEEGGGEGQPNHDFDRVFPPREASRRCGIWARTQVLRGSARSGFARSGARHVDAVAGGFGCWPVCPVERGRRLRFGLDALSGAARTNVRQTL